MTTASPGVYRAVVTDNTTSTLQVLVPQLLGAVAITAVPCLPPDWKGTLPAVGSNVWVSFEGGETRCPVWLGNVNPVGVPDVDLVGLVAWNQIIANPAAGPATSPALVAVTTTAVVTADRCYEICTSPTIVTATVSTDVMQIQLLDAGVGGTLTNASPQLTSVRIPATGTPSMTLTFLWNAPSTGSHPIGLFYLRFSGTGTVTPAAAATRPLQLTVKDVGPAIAAVT